MNEKNANSDFLKFEGFKNILKVVLSFFLIYVTVSACLEKKIKYTANWRIYSKHQQSGHRKNGIYIAWGYFYGREVFPYISVTKNDERILGFFVFSQEKNISLAKNNFAGWSGPLPKKGAVIEFNGKKIRIPIDYPTWYWINFPALNENNVFKIKGNGELEELPYRINKDDFDYIRKKIKRSSNINIEETIKNYKIK